MQTRVLGLVAERQFDMLLRGGGILSVILIFFWVYCIFDVISTDEFLCRNLPKTAWLVVVILLPDVGGLAWLLLGRPANAGFRIGDTTTRRSGSRGPDDDPMFGRSMYQAAAGPPAPGSGEDQRRLLENEEANRRLDEWEADLANREAAEADAEARRAALERREAELQRREQTSTD